MSRDFFKLLIKNNQHFIVVCLLWFLSLTCCFASCCFSPLNSSERAGNEMTKAALKEQSSLSFMTVESKNNSNSISPSVNTYRYFSTIYGKDTFQYLTTYNANKIDSSISLLYKDEDQGDEITISESISIISAQANSNYKIDGQWKHEYYDFNLMFEINKNYDPNVDLNIYITKPQADSLLRKIYPDKSVFSEAEYAILVNKILLLSVDSNVFRLRIWSIIVDDNVFYNNVINTIGDFVMLPNFKSLNEIINIQHCTIINDKLKQNINKIEYLKAYYPMQDFTFKFGRYNLEDSRTNFSFVFEYLENNYANLYIFIMLAITSLILFAFSVIIAFKNNVFGKKAFTLTGIFLFLFVHLIFGLSFLITKNIALYSSTAIIVSVCLVLLYGVVYVYFCKKHDQKIAIAFWKS